MGSLNLFGKQKNQQSAPTLMEDILKAAERY
jgi:hypothetical protein